MIREDGHSLVGQLYSKLFHSGLEGIDGRIELKNVVIKLDAFQFQVFVIDVHIQKDAEDRLQSDSGCINRMKPWEL